MDVQSADFNGDSLPDLVLAKEFQRNRLLLNNGAGAFTDATAGRLSNVARDSEDIAIADFDGNGWPDIVFAAEDDAAHEMYLNTGSGNFTDVSERLPNFVSNAVVAWDVNADSFPDLIFGNAGQNRIFINNGNGFFTDETTLRLPAINDITQDILLVDIDRDNDMDLAIGNEDGNRLLINNGSGIFSDQTLARLPQGVIMETRKISRADVNGDGYDDLFYCNMASTPGKDIRDRLYLNDGVGYFADATESHLPAEISHTFDAVFSDLNQDSKPDLIVGYLSNLQPAVFLNNGIGVFTDHTSEYLPPTAQGNNITVYLIDANGDGKKDLYLGRFQQNDRLFLYTKQTNAVTDDTPDAASICIYPNPSSGIFYLDFSSTTNTAHRLEIFNQLGQPVYAQTLDAAADRHKINAENLPEGLYILKVSDGINREAKKVIYFE